MAIVTGDLYKGFTFGDVSSKDYGVYITQEAAYNAPERDVDVVEIAGRNGAYILDKGRFKNITVSYKCGIALDDEQNFESAIRTFRNALSSKAGKYVRLEDEYNPNEYRQAAFLGGIEVDMADRRAGEFTVSFDAMPQRFLKSGETAVSVENGGTIINPTLFESHPLIQVWGYGDIGINDDTITIADDVIGDIVLRSGATTRLVSSGTAVLLNNLNNLRTGDTIRLTAFSYDVTITFRGPMHDAQVTVTDGAGFYIATAAYNQTKINVSIRRAVPLEFDYGTQETRTFAVTLTCKDAQNNVVTVNLSGRIVFKNGQLFQFFPTAPSPKPSGMSFNETLTYQDIIGDSTKSALGEPLYFDLDIGEAYKEEDGGIVSVNNAVSFPARLPVLKSGENNITYEDTVDQFKIVPRWWEV